jgi:hypothetical protein
MFSGEAPKQPEPSTSLSRQSELLARGTLLKRGWFGRWESCQVTLHRPTDDPLGATLEWHPTGSSEPDSSMPLAACRLQVEYDERGDRLVLRATRADLPSKLEFRAGSAPELSIERWNVALSGAHPDALVFRRGVRTYGCCGVLGRSLGHTSCCNWLRFLAAAPGTTLCWAWWRYPAWERWVVLLRRFAQLASTTLSITSMQAWHIEAQRHRMLCHAMLRYATLRYATLRYAMPCCHARCRG